METDLSTGEQWFVMRDLKRANAKLPAYKQLEEAGFRVFTPMTTKIMEKGGKKNTNTGAVCSGSAFCVFKQRGS